MPIAYNKELNEGYSLSPDGQSWEKTQVAINPQTGETLVLDGTQWVPWSGGPSDPEPNPATQKQLPTGGSIPTSAKTNEDDPQEDLSGLMRTLEAMSAPGRFVRGAVISDWEGEPVNITLQRAKEAWDNDPESVHSFVQLADRAIEKAQADPEGNPLLKAVADKPLVRTGLAVGGTAWDMMFDPLTLVGLTQLNTATNIMKGGIKAAKEAGANTMRSTKLGSQVLDKAAKANTAWEKSKAVKRIEELNNEYRRLVIQEGITHQPTAAIRAMRNTGLDGDYLKEVFNTYGIKVKLKNPKSFTPLDKAEVAQQTSSFLYDSKQLIKDAVGTIDRFIEPLWVEMSKISPKIADEMKKFEFKLGATLHTDVSKVKPWLDDFQAMDKPHQMEITRLLNLGRHKEALALMPEQMQANFRMVRSVLKEKYDNVRLTNDELAEVGNYFPRAIKSYKKMVDDLGLEGDERNRLLDMFQKFEADAGRAPNDIEAAGIVGKFLRGPDIEPLNKTKGFELKRKVKDISPEVSHKHYKLADDALLSYLRTNNHTYFSRMFFGNLSKELKEQAPDMEGHIATVLAKEITDGKINAKDAKRLRELLHARFIGGERGTNKYISNLKSAAYMALLGNPVSAAKQLGDLSVSAYHNGIPETTLGAMRVITGKHGLRFSETGLDISAEVSEPHSLQRLLDKVLSLSAKDITWKGKQVIKNPVLGKIPLVGFKQVDHLGKNVFLESVAMRLSRTDPKNTLKALSKYRQSFPDIKKVAKEFQDYKSSGVITDDMRYVMMSELLEVQPIVLSGLPEFYLKHPNGRVFYMLKSYALTQLSYLRRGIRQRMAQGKHAEAALMATYYVGLVGGANTSIEQATKLLSDDVDDLGFDEETLALIAMNTLKSLGLQHRVQQDLASGNLTTAAWHTVGVPLIDDVGKLAVTIPRMVVGATNEAEATKTFMQSGVRNIPVIGRVVYEATKSNGDASPMKLPETPEIPNMKSNKLPSLF